MQIIPCPIYPRMRPLMAALLLVLLAPLPTMAQDLWATFYGGSGLDWAYGVAEMPSGGYVSVGATQSAGAGDFDGWIFATDADGQLLWEKALGGPKVEKLYAVAVAPSGDIYAAGYTESFGSGGWDFWVIKLGPSGDILWQKAYGGTGYEFAMGIAATDDGGCCVVGTTSSFGKGVKDILALRLKGDGSIQWQKVIGGTNDDEATSICRAPDGGFCIAGMTMGFGAGGFDAWLIKIGQAGLVEWQKTFGGPGWDWLYSVTPTPDGGFATVGGTQSAGSGGYDLFLIKTDGQGRDLWETIVGGGSWDSGGGIVCAADGSLAVAGHCQALGSQGGDFDAWALKFDASGHLLGQNALYGELEDRGYGIISKAAGGFLLVGGTYSYGPASENAWLITLDPDMNPGHTCISTKPTSGSIAGKTFPGQDSDAVVGTPSAIIVQTSSESPAPFSTAVNCCMISCDSAVGPASGIVPLRVDFSGTSSARYCTKAPGYFWQFGDGGQGSGPSVSHTYGSPGTYTWNMVAAADGVSCARQGTILVNSTCKVACEAHSSLFVGPAPLPVSFSSALFPANCEGTPAYSWEFGDGATSHEPQPQHVYTVPGEYRWTFTVAWDGSTCSAQGAVTVSQPCTITCSAGVFPTSGEAPLLATFTPSIAPSHCNDPVIYHWDFGDGVTSAEPKPAHLYESQGTFSWSLTVTTGSKSCTSSGSILVLPPCVLTCVPSAAPSAGVIPFSVHFSAAIATEDCTEGPVFLWTFGDGESSVAREVTHSYAVPGFYEWHFSASSGKGSCSGTGTIDARSGPPGDCNLDGTVSIGEVQRAINTLLGLLPPDCGVDADGDGTVSIGEVQRVINAYLGLPWQA